MSISQRDIEHVFKCLRSGTVPERGLDAFAVGVERKRGEITRQFKMAEGGEGCFKFLRGGYGCGKTFMARLATLDAQERGFVTSFVVVSPNDLRFYKFEELYQKVMQKLSTLMCPQGGALSLIIDQWISKVEDMLISGGADEDADDFDEKVAERLKEELASMSGGEAPADMARVLTAIFELKQGGKLKEANSLISWLSGSTNVAQSEKKLGGVKGNIEGKQAMAYLYGILEIVKAAGYKGIVVVVDEVETVLTMRRDVRGKSLNGLRQIIDDANRPGLVWLFTGTPEFFESKKGVAGLAPLNDRIKLNRSGKFTNLRQPQLELDPFDAERLRAVGLKLREIYPSSDRASLDRRLPTEHIGHMISTFTEGFKGKVGVVPRKFLRRIVDELDLCEDNEGYLPMRDGEYASADLDEHDQRALESQSAAADDETEEEYEVISF